MEGVFATTSSAPKTRNALKRTILVSTTPSKVKVEKPAGLTLQQVPKSTVRLVVNLSQPKDARPVQPACLPTTTMGTAPKIVPTT